ncbi:MAG: hypothetical protein II852_07355 [Bacteroidales bacterium]|nr:hypothetical protein [Bacteroidales bacterium]
MDRVEICPKCGNYTEGKVEYSEDQKLAKHAIKKVTSNFYKWVFAGICGFLGVGIGHPHITAIIGFVIGFFVDINVAEAANRASDNLVRNFSNVMKFNFVCHRCGNLWTKFFHGTEDTTPDSVLLREKAQTVKAIKQQANSHWVKFGILAAVVLYCTNYCCTHDRTYITQEHLWGLIPSYEKTSDMWSFVMFILVIFGILVLLQVRKIFMIYGEANKVANLPISEYRYSEYRYYPKAPLENEPTNYQQPRRQNNKTQFVQKVQPSVQNRSNNNLLTCPDCGQMVSRRADACPNCGCPVSEMN